VNLVPLTTYERDATLEIFNMGVGAAAATLSEMVGTEVLLTLPSIDVISRDALRHEAWSPVAAVYQGFEAPFGKGRVILCFPEKRSLALVARLAHTDVMDELTALQEEALTEVGNILLNSCLARLSDLMRKEIIVTVPHLRSANALALLVDDDEAAGGILVISVQFALKDEQIDGRLLFLTEVERLKPMIQLISANLLGVG
jgi:chemotaxis protein CheC